jgi:hypothetical protein
MNSITAAKNRRVNPPSTPSPLTVPQNSYVNKSPIPPSQQPSLDNVSNGVNKNMNTGLTLPQVIQVVDIRLTNLEKTVLELKTNNNNVNNDPNSVTSINTSGDTISSQDLSSIVEEFDKRYEVLAQEVIELKDIVLKLQSYTMDVNKMLLEERNHIMEEIEKNNQTNTENL